MSWRTVTRVAVTGVVLAGGARLLQPADDDAEPATAAAPPASEWPSPATTGATSAEADLTPSTRCLVGGDEVVEAVLLDCPTGVGVGAGATLRNVIVRSDGEVGIRIAGDGAPALIEDVTITRSSACVPGIALGSADYVAKRVTVSGFTEAFRAGGDHVEVHDSYAKLCSTGGVAMTGFVGHLAGDDIVLSHTTLDARCPAEEVCHSDALVAWGGSGDRLLVAGNLLRGGGHTIRIGAGTGHTVRNNVVETGSYVFGPVQACDGVATWLDNREATLDAAVVARHEKPLRC